ncbi:MAG: hypothetical protein LBM75_07790 [Myxococcales bacterium]|jgi:hypothetical protein|nr:hypothetical protein [Myxococcales bacterium]
MATTINIKRVDETKKRERLAEGRVRIAKLLEQAEERAKATQPIPAPRYDKVYDEGVAWLDSLAGEQHGT